MIPPNPETEIAATPIFLPVGVLLGGASPRAAISKRVGFHTFRHTYTTLLTQDNEDVKVVQELLRRANSRITLDLYALAGMPEKRLAQSKVVRMVLDKKSAVA